jgi:hypothetical protein
MWFRRIFAMVRRLIIKLAALAVLALSLTALTPAAFAASLSQDTVSPRAQVCDEGWVFDSIVKIATILAQVGPTYRDYNGTSAMADMTLTSTVSGTVGVSTTIGAEANAGVIVANVKTSLSVNVSISITATVSNTFRISVPAHKAGYGNYGVFRIETSGHYYYRTSSCKASPDDGTITAYSPWYVGWNTWIGN